MKRATKSIVLGVLLLLVLVGSAFLVYSPHRWHPGPIMDACFKGVVQEPLGDYPYPLHGDGWNHLALTRQLIDGGGFSTTNPLLVEQQRRVMVDMGFHGFLAMIAVPFGLSYSAIATFVPAFFFLVSSLLLYLFFARVLKRPLGALVAIPLLAFIPGNANLLTNWFLAPIISVLFFLVLTLLLANIIRSLRTWIIVMGSLIILSFLVYPLATLLIAIYLFFHVGFGVTPIHRYSSTRNGLLALGSGLAIGLFITSFFVQRLKDFVFYPVTWSRFEFSGYLIDLIPIPVILIGIAGLYLLCKEKKHIGWFFSATNLLFLLITGSYVFFDTSVFLPFERLLFFWQLVIIIPAGFTLAWFFTVARNYLSKKWSKRFPYDIVLLFIVLGLIMVTGFSNYYVFGPQTYYLQRPISVDQIELLGQMQDPGVVYTDNCMGFAIYPLTGAKVLSMFSAHLSGGDKEEMRALYEGNCVDIIDKIDENNVDYVITKRSLTCGLPLVQIGYKDEQFLYAVQR